MPAEEVVPLGNGRVEVTFYATYQLFTRGDLEALSDIKNIVREAGGTVWGIPNPKMPALNASIPYYFPNYSNSDSE